MKKNYLIIALVATSTLSGCFSEKTRTVEYYAENAEARAVKIKECANNPGELEHTPNCQNAAAAQAQLEFNSSNTGMPRIRSNR